MGKSDWGDVTEALKKVINKEAGSEEELLTLTYDYLKGIANNLASGNMKADQLSPTELVHEAYLKLFKNEAGLQEPRSRGMLYSLSARAMRQILVDHYRKLSADKRPPDSKRSPLDEQIESIKDQTGSNIIDLDEALEKLNEFDPDSCSIIELKFFSGFTNNQISETLLISESTVERKFKSARAFLRKELDSNEQ